MLLKNIRICLKMLCLKMSYLLNCIIICFNLQHIFYCENAHFSYWKVLWFLNIECYICTYVWSYNPKKSYLKRKDIWTASSKFGTYRLCEQQRFRRACASAQSRQNLRCSLKEAVNQEEPSDRKPDPWPLWMAGHAQLKFVMTECSKTQIRLMGQIPRTVKILNKFGHLHE